MQIVADYHLARFACYLIARNGDLRKPEIVNTQKYFAVAFPRFHHYKDGHVFIHELKRISPKIAAEYERTKLQGGELLITLVGAIGRTAIAPQSLAGANTARAVGVVPLTSLVNASWVELWFRSPAKLDEMIGKAHEVARKTLNREDVRSAAVALPSVSEQTEIVHEVERRLLAADRYKWKVLVFRKPQSIFTAKLLERYHQGLRKLSERPGLIGLIFTKPQSKINDPAKLRLLIRQDGECEGGHLLADNGIAWSRSRPERGAFVCDEPYLSYASSARAHS
jgi:hypothetical protein